MESTPKISTCVPTSTSEKSNTILDQQGASSPPNPLSLLPPTNLSAGWFIELCSDVQWIIMKYLVVDDHLRLSLTCKSNQSNYSSTIWPFRFILEDNLVVTSYIAQGKTAQEIFVQHPLHRLPALLLKDQIGTAAAISVLRGGPYCGLDLRNKCLAEFQTKIASLRAKGFDSEADAICHQLFEIAIDLEVAVFKGRSAHRMKEQNLCCAKGIYASFAKEKAVDEITIEALIRENQIAITLFACPLPRMGDYSELPNFLEVATSAAETTDRKSAAYQLGEIYRDGMCVFLNHVRSNIEPNQEEARKYFEIAAKQGHTMAIEALATVPEKENCVIC